MCPPALGSPTSARTPQVGHPDSPLPAGWAGTPAALGGGSGKGWLKNDTPVSGGRDQPHVTPSATTWTSPLHLLADSCSFTQVLLLT